jgi:putative endonuclease
MKDHQYFVYILAKGRNSTFYTGLAAGLFERTTAHKEGTVDGFTKRYKIRNLVYYEVYDDHAVALHREKQLKKWQRTWKMRIIEEMNPNWEDLYEKIQA